MYNQLLLRPLGMLKSVNTEASEFTTVVGSLFPPLLVFTPLVNSLPWSLGWSWTCVILLVKQVTGPALRRPGSFCLCALGDPKPLGKKSSYPAGKATWTGPETTTQKETEAQPIQHPSGA